MEPRRARDRLIGTGASSPAIAWTTAEVCGDLAYTVALEHTTASVNRAEPTPYVLRVTTIFRREDGE